MTELLLTDGGPVTECGGIGASNDPLRGGKCNVWEGGTRGTAFVWSPLLRMSRYRYTHLAHAVDWLPTFMAAAGAASESQGQKPIDGFSLWDALNTNTSSNRSSVYYGVTDLYAGLHGPAVQDRDGWKLM